MQASVHCLLTFSHPLYPKGKGKVHPIIGHEGPEGEWRYSSTLSLTSALDGWMVNATPRPLYPRERPGTHCTGGWVGPRAGLDGCGKSFPTGFRSPDRLARGESLHRLSYPGPLPLYPTTINPILTPFYPC